MATVTYDNATRIYPGSDRPAVDSSTWRSPTASSSSSSARRAAASPPRCACSPASRTSTRARSASATATSPTSRPKDRDIAMVFQNYALYPHMTVAENMALRAQARARCPRTEIDQRVEEAARCSTSSEYLDRKPKALSGGQRQRVAMGRAIVREPQVFLMDEPLSNLDAKLRVQTRTQIAALQRRLGVTTVYVTHDQVEAMTMGDRVAVLKDGVLQQCRHAAARSTTGRPTCSSPGSSARRR